MRKKDTGRALGPYYRKDIGRWYVVLKGDRPGPRRDPGDARLAGNDSTAPTKPKRETRYYDSEAQARAVVLAFNQAATQRTLTTLAGAIEAYLKDGEERGLRTRTLDTAKQRLTLFFGTAKGRALRGVTPTFCETRYAQLRSESAGLSVATQRHTLAEAKRFLRWCATEAKTLAASPAESVKPKGKIAKRKAQLRLTEARTFVSVGEELLAAVALPDPVAAMRAYGLRVNSCAVARPGEYRGIVQAGVTAVLTALYLGLRASEISSRVVRDLDDEGRLLHVEGELKSESSARVLEVPERLRAKLLALAKGRAPTDALFGGTTRKTVHYWARRLAQIAGVPSVSAHGLRGSFASIARSQGAATGIVSAALGHGGEGVTLGHYIEPGAVERGNTRTVSERLDPSAPVSE